MSYMALSSTFCKSIGCGSPPILFGLLLNSTFLSVYSFSSSCLNWSNILIPDDWVCVSALSFSFSCIWDCSVISISFSNSSMTFCFFSPSSSLRYCSALNFISNCDIWRFFWLTSSRRFYSCCSCLFLSAQSSDFRSRTAELSIELWAPACYSLIFWLNFEIFFIFLMALFKSFSILMMRSNLPPLELPVPPSPSGSVTERDSRWYRLGLEPLPEARLAPRVRSFSLEAPRPKPCIDLLVFVPELSTSPSKSLSSWSEEWLLEDELPPFLKCIRGFVVDSFSFWTDSFSFLLQSAKIFWACPPRPNKLET